MNNKKPKKAESAFGGNFKKDILLIDLEFSGLDSSKHEILQIAGVLLDKKTLKEKQAFSSYVKALKWKNRDPESMAVNKITWEMVKDAPGIKEVIKDFEAIFGHDVIQAAYVGFNDKRFLLEAYKKNNIKYLYDYHFFDLWGLCYGYLAKHGLLKSQKDFAGFGLEYLVKMFKIKIDEQTLHDALVDCRVEAEVLRQIMRKI